MLHASCGNSTCARAVLPLMPATTSTRCWSACDAHSHAERQFPMDRPDYIVCIASQHADEKGLTLCGRPVVDFCFTGIDHAYLNARAQGALLTCEDCAKRVIAVFTEQLG